MTLSRKVYFVTEGTLHHRRGAIHESRDCTALRKVNLIRTLTAKEAQALLGGSRRGDGKRGVYLCARCKGMK